LSSRADRNDLACDALKAGAFPAIDVVKQNALLDFIYLLFP
jgi:hypothetical protein